jgi:hypothetical protein
MKKMIIFSLALCMAGTAWGQEKTDTLVIEKADKVVVTSGKNTMSVDVYGKKDNPDYHFSRSLQLEDDGVNVTRESNSDFDFKFPFTKSSEGNGRELVFTLAPTMSVGFVSSLGGPGQLETDFGKSVEITWHAFNLSCKNKNSPWKFSTGLWFNWKNYRMTGSTRFDLMDGQVVMVPYPEKADYKFSRIHTLSYQVPLIAQYETSKYFKFAAGALFNFNGHGNLKTKYNLDGKGYKDRDRGVHLNSFTTDIIGIVSYRNYLGAYVKYSPCNVLDTHRGPKFHGISAGLIWNW